MYGVIIRKISLKCNPKVDREEVRVSEEKWEELLAQPGAKRMMREMAHEALEDYRAGRTTDITFTEDGRLAPE
jgi:hypothetical protein